MSFVAVVEDPPFSPALLRRQLSSELLCDVPSNTTNRSSDVSKSPNSSVEKTEAPTRRKLARATTSVFAKSTVDPAFASRLRPTLILGLLFFRDKIDVHVLRKVLKERLLSQYGRFRSKIVLEGSKILFHELSESEISMDYHVQEIDATGWDQSHIDNFLSSKYNEDKSPDSPLWIFYILQNLADGRHCIIANIDHCIGDGITMVQVLLSLLDDTDIDTSEGNNAHTTATPTHVSTPLKVKKKIDASSLTLFESMGAFIGGKVGRKHTV
jgi:hypothetical protein